MSVGSILARITGAAAIGVAGFDAYKMTKIKAQQTTIKNETEYLKDIYVSHATSGNGSHATEEVKSWWREKISGSSWLKAMFAIKDYTLSAVGETFAAAGTIALGAGALAAGSKNNIPIAKHIGKLPGWAGKACAIVLGVMGAGTFLHEAVGVGKRKEL